MWISKILLISLLSLAFAGCSFVAPYNPKFDGEVASIEAPLSGKALIFNSVEDDKYAFSGKPTSFTGGGTALTIHLGEITRRLAAKAFGTIFEGGADSAHTLENIGEYTIVVKPKTTNYSYAYNQLKNAGFAITPQVDIGIEVKVLSSDGVTIIDKVYSSGLADGETYMVSGSPGEEVSKATHKVIMGLLNQAAVETYDILSKRASR